VTKPGITKADIVARIVGDRKDTPTSEPVEVFAPANIALCKYWGKRNEELNLPVTSSLSIALGSLGSMIRLGIASDVDTISLNGTAIDPADPFAQRVSEYLSLFRGSNDVRFAVDARNTIPTAAGLASSASGFAALVRALDTLFGWDLSERELSILARLGSGSAARSIFEDLVEWHAGSADDGMDCFAEPLDTQWPELRIALLILSDAPKSIGSRPAMQRTVATSPLYAAWPGTVERDLGEIKAAIGAQDFERLGRAAERNALTMHATMMAAEPAVLYWLPESVAAMDRARLLRDEQDFHVYFTMDAGPNVKLLYLAQDEERVGEAFPEMLKTDSSSS